jgi:hypothetical protein
MSRPFRGQESINAAQASLKAATTLGQLRQPQDVMLPLVYGLNLVQTAAAIGGCPRNGPRDCAIGS